MTTRLSPYTQQQRIADRFKVFHAEHPEVYERLVQLTRRAKGRGFKVGIATVYELVRWSYGMRGMKDAMGFRLNNDFRSHYARLIMETEPDLADVFETRVLRAP